MLNYCFLVSVFICFVLQSCLCHWAFPFVLFLEIHLYHFYMPSMHHMPVFCCILKVASVNLCVINGQNVGGVEKPFHIHNFIIAIRLWQHFHQFTIFFKNTEALTHIYIYTFPQRWQSLDSVVLKGKTLLFQPIKPIPSAPLLLCCGILVKVHADMMTLAGEVNDKKNNLIKLKCSILWNCPLKKKKI